MRYTILINAVKCQEWDLTLSQGALFDLLNQAHTWAKHIDVNGELFFWVSRNMIINEIPLAYSKPDTVYRAFKTLSDKGLIVHAKRGQKDLVRLTEKGKEWNAKNSGINPNVGNKSEIPPKPKQKNSEANPTFEEKLGNKSEKIAKNSEINPTNKLTINPLTINPITNGENAAPKPISKPTNESINESSSSTPKKQKPKSASLEKPCDVTEQTWHDLLALRKAKKSPLTISAWNIAKKQIDEAQAKTGHTLEQILLVWIERGWQGFKAEWYMNHINAQNSQNTQGNHNAINQPTYSPNHQQPVKSDVEIYRDKLMAEYDAFYGTASESAGSQGFSGNVYDLEKPV